MTVALLRDEPILLPAIQDPRHLILGVLLTSTLPVDVRIVCERRIQHQDLELTIRVIGESHWITLDAPGSQMLQEILACVSLPADGCSMYHPFKESQRCQYRHGPYSVRVWFEPMSQAIAERGAGANHLEVSFPHPFGHADLPFTRVWWSLSDTLVRWWTTHIYVAEHSTIAVLSESRYERSPQS